MTEAKIEAALAAKIEAAFASANITGVKVFRTFMEAAPNDAAVMEMPEDVAFVDLVPENRSQETWEIPQYDFPVNVRLRSRIECDPTGAAHFARVDVLAGLLAGYCGRNGAANARADFAISNEFNPHLVSLGGGENEVDRDEGFRSWSQSITIRGYLS